MKVTKFETNQKRDLFMYQTKESASKYKDNIEYSVLNVEFMEKPGSEFLGFGGAITEAAGVAYSKLSPENKKQFIKDYFSLEGSNYEICRLPIGSTDFSLDSYSYSYKKDLSDFSISRDYQYIIPLIKDIQEVKPNIRFICAPWSPPKFMKGNKLLILGGKLLKKYYSLYAQYICKYLLAYKEEGINIEFICAQNEPQAIQIWESCIYDSEEEIDFVENYLMPELNKNNLDTKVIIYDHNKEKLLSKVNQAFEYINDSSIIKGAAYHFYTGDHFEQLEMVKEKYPDLLLFHTEGCVEYSNTKTKNYISHGEKYGHDILGDLKHGCNGYIDWNILLDSKGGPNHKLNYCESPVMLCEDEKEYMKNITYYYITQFSRVILPGAKRLYTSSYNDKIEMLAYRNLDKTIGIVLLNRDDSNHAYNMHIGNKIVQDNLDSHAIVSYLIEE